MKRIIMIVTVAGFVFALWGIVAAGEKAPQKVHDLANTNLAALGKSALIIKAVKEQNAKNMTLESIKEMDEKWSENREEYSLTLKIRE